MQFSINYRLYKQNEAIDNYYERKRIHAERKKHLLQEKIKRRERKNEILLLMAATLILFCAFLLQLLINQDLQKHAENVKNLSTEVNELHQANLDTEKRLTSSVDFTYIQKQAKKFGMVRPEAGNIVYYTLPNTDFMFSFDFEK